MNKKKKVLTIITIILAIITIILIFFVFRKFGSKLSFEKQILPIASKNENQIFKINKITFFSNCDAKNKNSAVSNFTLENLYQFTDIAIFISNDQSEKNAENTFKKVTLSNINFYKSPSIRWTTLIF